MMGVLLNICADVKITLLGTIFGVSNVSFMSIYLVVSNTDELCIL